MRNSVSLLLLVCLVSFHLVGQARVGQEQTQVRMTSRYQAIETKARAASASDRESVQALAHTILTSPHVFVLPSSASSFLESKLTESDLEFREQSGPGVSEEQVVRLMNTLASKFNIPSYARTTPAQVRHLRMKLMIVSPSFMTNSLRIQGMKQGDSISTEMSPLQAMHLISALIDQKLLNDDYQDPSIDIDAAEITRRGVLSKKMSESGAQQTSIGSISNNTKHAEMREAISSGIQSMSAGDAVQLIDQILTTLHLN